MFTDLKLMVNIATFPLMVKGLGARQHVRVRTIHLVIQRPFTGLLVAFIHNS